jgi:hypothetical protein
VFDSFVEGDPASQTFMATIREGLAKLGWVEGRNLRIDVRHSAVAPDQVRAMAVELPTPRGRRLINQLAAHIGCQGFTGPPRSAMRAA